MLQTVPHIPLPPLLSAALADTFAEAQRDDWAYKTLVLNAYKDNLISRGKVRQLLNMSFYEGEEFLANNGAFYHYTLEDLEQDRQNLQKMFGE